MYEKTKQAKISNEREQRSNAEFNKEKLDNIKDSVGIDRGFATGETKKFEAPEPRGG